MPTVSLLRWVFDPVFFGLEHVPARGPVLLVGNHALMGVMDPPLIWQALRERKGVNVRTLGDRAHERIPLWRNLLHEMGVVEGTPGNCSDLMRQGAHIMVFPGGAREVAKRRGEYYRLVWKKRLGFARLAIRHGCPILPFASVGPEDCYRIVMDSEELLATPLGRLFSAAGGREDLVMPVVRGLGPTLWPRPERFYFKFSPLIETSRYRGQWREQGSLWELRQRTQQAIEASIVELKQYRKTDPQRGLVSRLLQRAGRLRPRRAGV